jgi:predicted transposase/invertase (TIGR01784 family)
LSLHFFELPKLPASVSADNIQELWLALFKAETEEEMARILSIGGSIMEQAVEAYHRVTATDEFKQLERMKFDARCREVTGLYYARREGQLEARRETARKFKSMGMNVEDIATGTGLTIDEVLRL